MAHRTSATPAASGQATTGAAAPAVSDPAAAGAAAPTASDPAATGAATPATADMAAAGSGDPDVADKAAAKEKTVTLRHTTPYKVYRRAGIVMTAQPKEYAVTVEQLADLKGDVWVEVIEK